MTPPKPTGAFAWTQAAPGLVLRCTALDGIVPHLFTTASVQLRDDEREWDGVAAEIGVARSSLRLIRQVHGRDVVVVKRGDALPADRPEGDIIISNDPCSAIGVRTADCAAVLIVDPDRGVVAAAHAGWRGTRQNVAGTAVKALRVTFGSQPAKLIAAVGPSLGQCCGEMGPEVVEQFRAAGHDNATIDRWFTIGPRGRPHFDLWLANEDQLAEAGVPPAAIHVARLCTRCRPDVFHSYRAAGTAAGRMVGVIRAPIRP